MPSSRSRRSVLATFGAAVGLAGCTARPEEPPAPGVDDPPDPDGHVFGANGEWSSFGCNASNTREVADGKAPVDDVDEQWRVEVPQLFYQEPIVADGRVYLAVDELRVYDAVDGSEQWTNADASTTPLVRGDTVFVGAGSRLLALDAGTGEPKWEREFTENASVRSPAMYGRNWLYVPAGETIHRVDAETGDVDWSRRLFGRTLGSPPIYSGMFVAVATEAGKLFVLDHDGVGWGEWDFPSTPQAPPAAGTDGIYITCSDGRTHGINLEAESRSVDWSVDTSWASGGLAVNEHLYATGGNGLYAIDPERGERVWTYDTGSWRWTAPAIARDTLFVGGDRLYALDPTPKFGLLDDGPAIRFEKSFYGRVGPGPVLNDGVLFTIAQTGESSFHLLALA